MNVASLAKEHAAAELQLERARMLLLKGELLCEKHGVEPPGDLLDRLRQNVRDCQDAHERALVRHTDALTPQYLRQVDKLVRRARRARIPCHRGRSRPRARRHGGQRHATKRQSGVSPPEDDPDEAPASSSSSTRSEGRGL